MEYEAVPLTEAARIETARTALQPTSNSPVTIEPLLVNQTQFWVALPANGNNGSYQQRPGASVDLRSGLKDQARLTLDQFQKIYVALFTKSHTLFTGEVRFVWGADQERIPFEARVIDQSPEAFWDRVVSRPSSSITRKLSRSKSTALPKR